MIFLLQPVIKILNLRIKILYYIQKFPILFIILSMMFIGVLGNIIYIFYKAQEFRQIEIEDKHGNNEELLFGRLDKGVDIYGIKGDV